MSYISIEHLTKEIGNDTVLKDVTLSLEKKANNWSRRPKRLWQNNAYASSLWPH